MGQRNKRNKSRCNLTTVIDDGIFRYSDKGFFISLRETKEVAWSQIQSIFGYKVDLFTTDEICMDVFCDNDISFTVTEETAGWYVFLERLKQEFPTIEEDWNMKIAQPAFATNLTLVYDRDNRTHEQVVGQFYGDKKKAE